MSSRLMCLSTFSLSPLANRPATLLVWALIFGWMEMQGFAVDPPPPSILRAPKEQQLRYLKKQGIESEEQRSAVAKRRFHEKQLHREAVTVGMTRELAFQREAMALQETQSSTTFGAETFASRPDSENSGGVFGRFIAFGLVAGLLLLIYHTRDQIFRAWQQLRSRNGR